MTGRRGHKGAGLIAQQDAERFRKLGANLTVVINFNAGEERLIQLPTHRVSGLLVARLRIGNERECVPQIDVDAVMFERCRLKAVLDLVKG